MYVTEVSKILTKQRKSVFLVFFRSKSRYYIHHGKATPSKCVIPQIHKPQIPNQLRKKTPPSIYGFHTSSLLEKIDEESPYWLCNDRETETKVVPKRKYFNFRLPKFNAESISLVAQRKWPPWKSTTEKSAPSNTEKYSDDDEIICDDSVTTMHFYQNSEITRQLERDEEKRLLRNELSKISPIQEDALITEYLKYQKDLGSRLTEFWGSKPSASEKETQRLAEGAQNVKTALPYASLNKVLDSYSATINSLSNVHKHLQKYERFIPQKLMDIIPGFTPQAANASILEGTSEDPDVVTVKNVQGLRTLLKNLEEEESRIDKERIKARQTQFRDETFQRLFACQFSPFRRDAITSSNVAEKSEKTEESSSSTKTRKRWHIPGWDPSHSVANKSLFPSSDDTSIPGRNAYADDDDATVSGGGKKERKLSKLEMEESFQELIRNVKKSHSATEFNQSLHALNSYLKQNSKLRYLLYEQNLVYLISKQLKTTDGGRDDEEDLTRALSMEALTLAGRVPALTKRGIRILAIDGGGVRAVMTALILQRLQEECGMPLHEMFDYVIGVSTGSILTVMSIVYRVPLDDCLQMYKLFSLEVFKRNIILGATRMVWNQSFYDSDYWSALLREDFGDLDLSETARRPDIPKIAIVSTATNTPTLTPFVFRNYNLPPNTPSQYPGSCNARVWEAVRASSAAPGYFEEYKLRDVIHQDGGLLVNNPAALAIHEAKLLWPREEIQCLVSLGTGRYYPHARENYAASGLKSKINKLIASATDVEAVHIVLQDLLPKGRYFRFNPYMQEDILLDENRPEKIDQLVEDVRLYLRKNGQKLSTAATKLEEDRQPWQKLKDFKTI